MPNSANYSATTYDQTHGWLMWKSEEEEEVLQYTRDGEAFGTFPVPEWAKGLEVRCLESLNNGGDIFMAGRNSTYIYRHNDSTLEQQPDMPTLQGCNSIDI